MSECPGCGGTVGRDCFNPQECEWIMRDMAARYQAQPYDPTPCQGCHAITQQMVPCLGICAGLTSDDDVAARREVWLTLPTPHAAHLAAQRPTPAPTEES